ncbi:MAG: hypothetical protein HY842_18415 [Bacteroidetes bacterium]|nr:hypothetical protein [Bacteroidota bacterium]
MHSTTKLLTHPAMAALRQAIQRELWLKLTVAVVFIAGGVAGAWYFYKKENLVVSLGMAGVLLGLWFLREYLWRPAWRTTRCGSCCIGSRSKSSGSTRRKSA